MVPQRHLTSSDWDQVPKFDNDNKLLLEPKKDKKKMCKKEIQIGIEHFMYNYFNVAHQQQHQID